MKRLIKLLHEVGALGVAGSLAACIVLVATAPAPATVEYAAARQGILAVSRWLFVPSLAVVLVSGLLAIAANNAYKDAGWAWLKALLGISMFEGSLLTIAGSARRAAELSALAVTGHGDPAQLAQVLRTEWAGLWVMFAISIANVVLGVWRPRFTRRQAS